MLKITDINEFRSHISHKEEIREMDIADGLTSFCYMISADGTFDTPWARECRGIVFSKATRQVVGRPLHKFFNVGERPETRVESVDWSKVVRVMSKRDGSMIHTVVDDEGIIRLKSKKTFNSEVAKAAQEWMDERPRFFQFACNLTDKGFTLIFEWTAPDARIVLFYPEAELQLLHVRHNVTGEYLDHETMREYASHYGVKCVDEVDTFFDIESNGERRFDAHAMLDAAHTTEGIEGWVVQFENGDMVKVKTKWYLERHRVMTFLRERDIAEAVLNESLDDLKSLLATEGVDISEILKIEDNVLQTIRNITHEVNSIVDSNKFLSRKDFAIKFNDHPSFGLLMATFLGKDPDFKSFFERNILKQRFSLRQLVLVPSVAEAD